MTYLKDNKVVGLEGIDTRKLVKHIRTQGAMKGIISSDELNVKKLSEQLAKYPGLVGRDIVKDVTVKKSFPWDEGVVDCLDRPRMQTRRKNIRSSPSISV